MLSAMVDMIQKCTENLPSKRAEVPVGMLGHRACITEEQCVWSGLPSYWDAEILDKILFLWASLKVQLRKFLWVAHI